MKKVTFFTYLPPQKSAHYTANKLYRVHLGSMQFQSFSNKKDCEKFLNQANKFVNITLQELNHIYGHLFLDYRNNWFYLSGRKYTEMEKNINMSLKRIDRAFSGIIYRTGGPNQNSFAFDFLHQIATNLITFCALLEHLASKRFNYTQRYQMKATKSRLKAIEKRIKLYPL